MTYRFAFLLAIVALCFPHTSYADKSITIATSDWPPYTNSKLKTDFTRQVISAAFAEEGIEVQFNFLPWTRALKDTGSGKFDAITPIYMNAERLETLLFSAPFYASDLVLLKPRGKNSTRVNFSEQSFCVVAGYHNTPMIDTLPKEQKVYAKSDAQCIDILIAERSDYAVMDRKVAEQIMKERSIKSLEVIPNTLDFKPFYIAFPRSLEHSSNIVSVFNRGFWKIFINGKLNQLRHMLDPE